MFVLLVLINIIIPIVWVFSIGAIITAFFYPSLAYGIIAIPFLLLIIFWLWGKILRIPEPIPELSEAANEFRGKYRAFYISPVAGKNCRAATSVIGLALVAITIIACINRFWCGIAIGAVIYFFVAQLARAFDPLDFLTPEEKTLHQEIVKFYRNEAETATDEQTEV